MMKRRAIAPGLLILGMFAIQTCAFSQEKDMAQIEKQFRELPMEARRLTGPLFWLHGDESPERLTRILDKVAEGGNGCFTAESRPHNDWLGPAWFRDLDICLQAAKKNDLKMFIFDEKWWPSGEVAGRVPAQYGSKKMEVLEIDVQGPKRLEQMGLPENRIAALAGRVTAEGVEGDSLIDLRECVSQDRLVWEAPEGQWKVMVFSWKSRISGSRYLVDGASQDSVDWYIQTVYQPHYERFKDDFGKSIVGFFYDEPETHGDWGTEVMTVLRERNVDWKKALVAWKVGLAGEEQSAGRYQYQDALAEAWGRTLYGGLSRWCRERGVVSIGHFLEHRVEYLHPDLCAGNMFQLMKYSDMGGIDAVFTQFKPGQREAYDAPCWQTPKLGSSVTHAYGKPDDVTMVEIFGARGQDLSYPEMKWWTDHMQVSGVNFLIPHSFNPRAPLDTDCPPYFYNGGFEPRWPLYRVFADYTSRLSLMLTGGRHVAPVALLFLGTSRHAGRSIPPDVMSEVLQDALYDCDWLPYEVFEKDVELGQKEIQLREERYRVLVVPPVEVIPYATLDKAKAFFEKGGVVVGYGFLPTQSATLGRTERDIQTLREAIWGEPQPGLKVCRTNRQGGRSYLLPEKPTPEDLQAVLAEDAKVRPTLEVIEGKTDHWLHALHRVKAGRDLFFVANQNVGGAARQFRLRLWAEGEPECWDAMRNEITGLRSERHGRFVDLDLLLEPSESALLVFQPEKRPLPLRINAETRPSRAPISVSRETVPREEPAPPWAKDQDEEPSLKGSSWIWTAEGQPATSALPGTRYFRGRVAIPEDRKIQEATLRISADNAFVLFVNGNKAGESVPGDESWRQPVRLDLTGLLHPGSNLLAVEARNATLNPSPAGLVGRLRVELDQGDAIIGTTDASWKATAATEAGWDQPGFDDSAWLQALEAVPYGEKPWGDLSSAGRYTKSPVKADPFHGHCEIPSLDGLSKARIYLRADGLAPEEAARVTVNGEYAGGFIGKPLRLEISRHLKPGDNEILIEPFAPQFVLLEIDE